MAPVQPAITLTPIQAHVTTKSHMTATNEQLSENGKLTQRENPTEEAQDTAHKCSEMFKQVQEKQECFKLAHKLAAEKDCRQTSGGSWLCVPKPTNPTPTVASARHTGERKVTEEFGPGWRELLPGETCKSGQIIKGGKTFCHEAQMAAP